MKEIRGRIRSMLGKILIGISGVLLLATVGLVIVQKASPQELTNTTNPVLSWDSNQLDVVMFPGTSTTTKVSFRSSQALTDLNVSLNQPLATIASATPKIFYSIEPNKDYTVTLTLKAPPEFTKRSYGGVLALTDAHGVVSQPLQVGAKMDWNILNYGAYKLDYPINLVLQKTDSTYILNDREVSLEGDYASSVEISTGGSLEVLRQYIKSIISSGYFEQNLSIDGIPSVKVSGILNSSYFGFGGEKHTYILIPQGIKSTVISCNSSNPSIADVCDSIALSLRILQ